MLRYVPFLFVSLLPHHVFLLFMLLDFLIGVSSWEFTIATTITTKDLIMVIISMSTAESTILAFQN